MGVETPREDGQKQADNGVETTKGVLSYEVGRLRQLTPQLISGCMAYASMPCWDMELSKALIEFYGFIVDVQTAEEEILDGEAERVRFYPWVLWDWATAGSGPSIGERFSELYDRTELEGNLLKALCKSYVSFYEALDDASSQGVMVRNLATGEVLRIHDDGLAGDLLKGHILLARLARVQKQDGEVVVVDAVYACLPAETRDTILAELDNMLAEEEVVERDPEYVRKVMKKGLADCLDFADQLLEALAQPPEVTNGDGDPLLLCQSTVTGEDAERLLSFLELQEGLAFEACGNGIWLWKPDGRHLGFIHQLERGKLRLAANSQTRHHTLQESVVTDAQLTGPKLRSLTSFYDAVERWTHRGGGESWMSGDPDVPGAVMAWLEFWARNWVDLPSTDLEGRTPREAVRYARGRQLVERVLQRFEGLRLGRLSHTSSPCFDRLRHELGLDTVS
jgi:hypothetical protein